MLLDQILLVARKGFDDIVVHIAVLFKGNALEFAVIKPFQLDFRLILTNVLIKHLVIDRKTASGAAGF